MQIVIYPDKRLHEVSKEINILQYNLYTSWKMIDKMTKLMQDNNGCGLAGVQVGILKRFFIINICGEVIVVYNPKITYKSGCMNSMTEGCLSLPNKQVNMLRSAIIKGVYMDKNFNPTLFEFKGINAVIFQHEYDHLEGKLIIDKD